MVRVDGMGMGWDWKLMNGNWMRLEIDEWEWDGGWKLMNGNGMGLEIDEWDGKMG